eukprot:tig00021013_g17069.t1
MTLADYVVLSTHFAEAGDSPDVLEKAVSYSLRAGSLAENKFSNQEACTFYLTALHLCEKLGEARSPRVAQLYRRLGDVQASSLRVDSKLFVLNDVAAAIASFEKCFDLLGFQVPSSGVGLAARIFREIVAQARNRIRKSGALYRRLAQPPPAVPHGGTGTHRRSQGLIPNSTSSAQLNSPAGGAGVGGEGGSVPHTAHGTPRTPGAGGAGAGGGGASERPRSFGPAVPGLPAPPADPNAVSSARPLRDMARILSKLYQILPLSHSSSSSSNSSPLSQAYFHERTPLKGVYVALFLLNRAEETGDCALAALPTALTTAPPPPYAHRSALPRPAAHPCLTCLVSGMARQAREYCALTLQLCNYVDDRPLVAQAYAYLAWYFAVTGQWGEADESIRAAVAIFEEHGDGKESMQLLSALAGVGHLSRMQQARPAEVLATVRQLRDAAESIGDVATRSFAVAWEAVLLLQAAEPRAALDVLVGSQPRRALGLDEKDAAPSPPAPAPSVGTQSRRAIGAEDADGGPGVDVSESAPEGQAYRREVGWCALVAVLTALGDVPHALAHARSLAELAGTGAPAGLSWEAAVVLTAAADAICDLIDAVRASPAVAAAAAAAAAASAASPTPPPRTTSSSSTSPEPRPDPVRPAASAPASAMALGMGAINSRPPPSALPLPSPPPPAAPPAPSAAAAASTVAMLVRALQAVGRMIDRMVATTGKGSSVLRPRALLVKGQLAWAAGDARAAALHWTDAAELASRLLMPEDLALAYFHLARRAGTSDGPLTAIRADRARRLFAATGNSWLFGRAMTEVHVVTPSAARAAAQAREARQAAAAAAAAAAASAPAASSSAASASPQRQPRASANMSPPPHPAAAASSSSPPPAPQAPASPAGSGSSSVATSAARSRAAWGSPAPGPNPAPASLDPGPPPVLSAPVSQSGSALSDGSAQGAPPPPEPAPAPAVQMRP